MQVCNSSFIALFFSDLLPRVKGCHRWLWLGVYVHTEVFTLNDSTLFGFKGSKVLLIHLSYVTFEMSCEMSYCGKGCLLHAINNICWLEMQMLQVTWVYPNDCMFVFLWQFKTVGSLQLFVWNTCLFVLDLLPWSSTLIV